MATLLNTVSMIMIYDSMTYKQSITTDNAYNNTVLKIISEFLYLTC
jgi:hypothetical protein